MQREREQDHEQDRVLGEDEPLPEGARIAERKVVIERFEYADEPSDILERDPRDAPRRRR